MPSTTIWPAGAQFSATAHRARRFLRGRVAGLVHALRRYRDLRRLAARTRPLAIIATFDLSRSGAPLLVVEMARLLSDDGYAPVVLSFLDGPFRRELEAIGVPVLVDPALGDSPAWLRTLAGGARFAICNTVRTVEVAAMLAPIVPTLWYLHEVSLLEEQLREHGVRRAIGAVASVWAGSSLCADLLISVRADVSIVPYGIPPLGEPPTEPPVEPLRVGLFGSVEPRKGQDLAVAGYAMLPPELRARIALTLHGRVLDQGFATAMLQDAAAAGVAVVGELDRDVYETAMRSSDAVLVASRDDTLPLVSIDALGLGRMLLLTPGVGTSAWLTPGVDALIADTTSAEGIAMLLGAALDRRADAVAIGSAARATFDRAFSPARFHARLTEAVVALERAR